MNYQIEINEKTYLKCKKIIKEINNKFFEGKMQLVWSDTIEKVFEYGFNLEVVMKLFKYCSDKKALYKKYVESVADAWYSNNIRNEKDLEVYTKKRQLLEKLYQELALTIKKELTMYEIAYIEKWNQEYEISLEKIKEVLNKTKYDFDYANSLLLK